MTHRQLVEELAQVKETQFLEVPLGSVWCQHPPRADVVSIRPSYTRFCVSIFEVKTSRSDFLLDFKSGKWRGYLEHCHRFYFACPVGIIQKSELPEEAGLYVRGEKGWKCVKLSKSRDLEVPYTTLLSMIFIKQKAQNLTRRYWLGKYYSDYTELTEQFKRIAQRIKKTLEQEKKKNKS